MNWYWYWTIKKQHKPKSLCSGFWLSEIDSFDMFKHQEAVQFVRESADKLSLSIPRYSLKAFLQDDDSLLVQYSGGTYVIPVEKKSCNYGGFYCFFHCPKCNARMRKLYCIKGMYLCRKCANLGYYSQRLRPTERCKDASYDIEKFLKNRGGSLRLKPPRMKKHTFQKLRQKYVRYDQLAFLAHSKELLDWHGERARIYLNYYRPPDDMYDAYVDRFCNEELESLF